MYVKVEVFYTEVKISFLGVTYPCKIIPCQYVLRNLNLRNLGTDFCKQKLVPINLLFILPLYLLLIKLIRNSKHYQIG